MGKDKSKSVDISDLGRAELLDLRHDIDTRLKKLEKDERKAALAAMEQVARDAGFTMDDLLSGAAPVKKAKSPAKYRDPETGKEWSGRGRRPDWIKAAGDDLSQFEI